MATNVKVQNKNNTGDSDNTTAFNDVLDGPGAGNNPYQVVITKGAGTGILVSVGFDVFSNSTQNIQVAVNDGTTDHVVGQVRVLGTNGFSCPNNFDYIIPGLAAGTYTLTLRWKGSSGSQYFINGSMRPYISAMELNAGTNVKNANHKYTSNWDIGSVGVYQNVLQQNAGSACQVTITKASASTGLLVRGCFSYYCNSTGTNWIGVNDGSQDYDLGREDSASNTTNNVMGERYITGLPAGTYTFTLRFKLGAGAAVAVASENAHSLTVAEVQGPPIPDVTTNLLAYWNMAESDTSGQQTLRLNKTGTGTYHLQESYGAGTPSDGQPFANPSYFVTTTTGLRGTGVAARTLDGGSATTTNNGFLSYNQTGTSLFAASDSYTICGWFRPTTLTGGNTYTLFRIATTNGNADPQQNVAWLSITGAGSPFDITYWPTQSSASYTVSVASAGTVVAGTWIFVAIQRDIANNLIKIKVNNGAWTTAACTTNNRTTGTITTRFGSTLDGTGAIHRLDTALQYWGIWNRVLPDAAVDYLFNSGNGILSSEASITATYSDPYFADWVTSQIPSDGTNGSTSLTDNKGLVWTANGNAQLSTAQSKFGGSSMSFDGSGDWFQTPTNNAFAFTAEQDFTIEFWVRLNAQTNNYGTILGTGTASFSGNAIALVAFGTGVATYNQRIGLRGAAFGASPFIFTGVLTTNTWYHIALVKQANTWRIYVDGVQAGTASSATPRSFNDVHTRLGSNGFDGAHAHLDGYIDDFRVTKGVCRYPNGTTFTPPATPNPTF